MSLAMFAAPFNNNSINESFTNDSENIMNKKNLLMIVLRYLEDILN